MAFFFWWGGSFFEKNSPNFDFMRQNKFWEDFRPFRNFWCTFRPISIDSGRFIDPSILKKPWFSLILTKNLFFSHSRGCFWLIFQNYMARYTMGTILKTYNAKYRPKRNVIFLILFCTLTAKSYKMVVKCSFNKHHKKKHVFFFRHSILKSIKFTKGL